MPALASIDEHVPFVLAQQMKLLLVRLLRQNKQLNADKSASSRETKLMMAFREHLEKYYLSHLSGSDYAQRLHVSVSTLNRVCQKHVGKTPKVLILMRFFTEAKRRLLHTQQTLDGISFTLGFKDMGYFCRQFKKMTSLTLGEYRQNNRL